MGTTPVASVSATPRFDPEALHPACVGCKRSIVKLGSFGFYRWAPLLGLVVLGCSIFLPTRELGDTAVFGRAYLWGESSLRTFPAAGASWFVDELEKAQIALFIFSVLTAVWTLWRERLIPLFCGLFSTVTILDVVRGVQVDGSAWADLTLHFGWVTMAAALSLSGLVMVRTRPSNRQIVAAIDEVE